MGERPAEASGPPRARRVSLSAVLDGFFFVYAGLASIWLAWLVLEQSFDWGWFGPLFFVVFWLVLAYLVLPRLHRILTTIYVPDYFIGRARTSDGLLGDPVNLALRGDERSLHEAMAAAGWTRADDVDARSSWRIIASTLTRRSYDEAPVSPLFLFGRMQDFAYQQEVAGNPAKRHHVRFWRTPDGWLLPGGRRVDWLAAGTFDRSVGFSLFTLQITHKIDADTDVERDHIVRTLVDSGVPVEVGVISDFSTGYHSRNGGGDTIRTDGDLPVVVLGDAIGVEPAAADAAARARRDELEAALAAGGGPGEVGKRTAFEPFARLAERDTGRMPRPAAARRPITISLGAALILVRVLLGVVWLISLAMQWPTIVGEAADIHIDDVSDADAAQIVLWFIVGAGAIVLLAQLVFAWLVFRGSNWARVTVMVVAVLSTLLSAIDYWVGSAEITIRTTLLTLAVDILVLLALSSRAARTWSRRPRYRPAG
ncbi:LssY C-terminal domain-containing protein [Agromyces sp. H3Y2-19a]|uniref:LssY C-terminal domain-containing protein n=1 Tax=Agromyces chromiiresistens TaxID=3030835 RepID=UPI0023B941B1|nr:LssY C-terminal domain-containing protein [Agromyces chromiiresistens]MDF0513607.1 LssY C-terminal domain-containing protein [Agromyces chromiiresistens]